MAACCLCALVFKIVLGLLNTTIMLAGLVVAAVGGILLGLASNMVLPRILQGVILSALSTLNVVDKTSMNNIPSNMPELLAPAGTALVVVGLIIAAVGAVGYFGLSFNLLMKIYTVLIIVLVAIEIIVVAVYFGGALHSQLRTFANATLVEQYDDFYDAKVYSMLWNAIMINYNCCGMDGYTDFFYTAHPYPRNDTIKVNGQSKAVTLTTPLACCKWNGTFPAIYFVDDYCAVTPLNGTSNWETGCWGSVYKALNTPAIIAICSMIILAQAAIAVMALIIIRENASGSSLVPL